MDWRESNRRNWEARREPKKYETKRRRVKSTKEIITSDIQKLEENAEKRTLSSIQLFQEEIIMIEGSKKIQRWKKRSI
jgi:hypothetical protein